MATNPDLLDYIEHRLRMAIDHADWRVIEETRLTIQGALGIHQGDLNYHERASSPAVLSCVGRPHPDDHWVRVGRPGDAMRDG